MTREESTDPKPYTIEEARGLVRLEQGVPGSVRAVAKVGAIRLLATAQAAAEADSLRAQLSVAVEERNSLRDDHAHSKHVQWLIVEHRNELEAATTELRAQLERARLDFSNCADVGRRLEAALTTAQGEVAVLREQLQKVCDVALYDDEDFEGWCRTIVDEGYRLVSSTRATADAYDERVRREMIEKAHNIACPIPSMCTEDGPCGVWRQLRALAHPTKEPSTDTKEKP